MSSVRSRPSAQHGARLLDRIEAPADLRNLAAADLPRLAQEVRQELIDAVSVTGGHLGAGLGVVELTIALHYVFDTPTDRLIWDVGHQAYPHKILTGRRDRIRTLRQGGGLSGFTSRTESVFDPFGAAHSSTSISAGLGMAVARDLDGRCNNVVAVIGDGAMSAGMAYEAMNNAGAADARLIVVLNDNDMSISPPTGALSHYLARASTSGNLSPFARFRQATGEEAAEAMGTARRPRRGDVAHLLVRRRLLRGVGVLLRRPHRRARSRAPVAGAAQRAGCGQRPHSGARAHAEGQGLCACRGRCGQVPWRRQVRRGLGQAGTVPRPRRLPTPRCSGRR